MFFANQMLPQCHDVWWKGCVVYHSLSSSACWWEFFEVQVIQGSGFLSFEWMRDGHDSVQNLGMRPSTKKCDCRNSRFVMLTYSEKPILIYSEKPISRFAEEAGLQTVFWHIHDLVMEVTMCCKPTILVYVCIWAYVGLSCIWVLYFCCCKVRPNVLLQRPAETRWRDGQFLFYDATRRFRMHFI